MKIIRRILFTRLFILFLMALAIILLLIGIFAPLLRFIPQDNVLLDLASAIDSSYERKVEIFSTIEAIKSLFNHDDYFVAAIFCLSSIVLPLTRFSIYCLVMFVKDTSAIETHGLKIAELLNKYCFLDILILALLVVTLSNVVNFYSVEIAWGIWFLGGSIVISWALPVFITSQSGLKK